MGSGTSSTKSGNLTAGDNDYYLVYANGWRYLQVRGYSTATTGAYTLQYTRVGNNITFETKACNGSTTDTYIHLYNSNYVQLAFNDDGGAGYFSKITLAVSPDGNMTKSNIESEISEKQSITNVTNYPNPFSDFTNIEFTIDADTYVTMTITDVAGRVVARPLNNQFTSIGRHITEIDAGDLPNGLYFYTLEANGQQITNQMALMR